MLVRTEYAYAPLAFQSRVSSAMAGSGIAQHFLKHEQALVVL